MARKPKTAEVTEAPPPETPAEQPEKRGRGRPKLARPQNGPSPEEIAECLARFTIMTTEAAKINQEKSTLLTNFKKSGGDVDALKETHRALKLDPKIAQAQLESKIRYLHQQGIKVSWAKDGQAAMDDILGPTVDKSSKAWHDGAAARANSDGINSGRLGAAPSDNPFHAGTEEYVAWHEGRDSGQEQRMAKKPEMGARVQAGIAANDALPDDGKGSGETKMPF